MNNDVLDLGPIDGPILLFDGPYSNLAATRAMREVAERLQIPPEQCICTGDIVAYCGEPSETLELIRDWNLLVVMGNCEESLAQSAPDCGCGFEQGSACSLLSDDWYLLLEPRGDSVQAGWHPLSYPFDTTARIMRERGLDNGYARALETGLWPSTDVLPGVERTQVGQMTFPTRLTIR